MLDYIGDHYSPPLVYEERLVQKRKSDYPWEIPLQEIAAQHLITMEPKEMDADWKLNDFFGTIVVINLARSTDRLARITEELKAIGCHSFELCVAIDGRREIDAAIWGKFYFNREGFDDNNVEGRARLVSLHQGEAGCYMSHYKALKQVKEAFDKAKEEQKAAQAAHDRQRVHSAEEALRRYSRILILEDDAAFGFVNNGQVIKEGAGILLRQALAELPQEWHMLYLVAHALKPTKQASPHLCKLQQSWDASAYVVNHTMYTALVNHLSRIENPNVLTMAPLDLAISSMHSFLNVYAIYPSLAYQVKGKSDISLTPREEMCQGQPVYP